LQLNKFPLGIAKDPKVPTFYAVKLKAKARLLFSPFSSEGGVTLTAYSAAKPFGSRVGVDLTNKLETTAKAYGHGQWPDLGGFGIREYPNPLVSTFDRDSKAQGFASNGHLGYLRAYETLTDPTGNSPPVSLTSVEKLRLAGAYAPWEIGYYTIPANYDAPQAGMGMYNNNPFYDKDKGYTFTITAPLLPINGPSSDLGFIRDRVRLYLTDGGIQDGDIVYQQLVDTALDDDRLTQLLNFITANGFDKGHAIPDPMLNDVSQALRYARTNGARYTVAAMDNAAQRQLTSWSSHKNPKDRTGELDPRAYLGRSSYSVRLFSFKSLGENLKSTNDDTIGETASNPLTRLDMGGLGNSLQSDLTRIKH
jgi:hypothetical protein